MRVLTILAFVAASCSPLVIKIEGIPDRVALAGPDQPTPCDCACPPGDTTTEPPTPVPEPAPEPDPLPVASPLPAEGAP